MKWPNGMEPGSVAVYARNEIEIAAAPERVWRWLIGGEQTTTVSPSRWLKPVMVVTAAPEYMV
ncbi:MAG: hypothetical protein ACXWM1_12375, partial [Candidatus Binataceae bacterium]